MAYTYESADDPTYPKAHVDKVGLTLTNEVGGFVTIPNESMLKDSMVVIPGGKNGINLLRVTLIVGETTIDDTQSWTEEVEPVRRG